VPPSINQVNDIINSMPKGSSFNLGFICLHPTPFELFQRPINKYKFREGAAMSNPDFTYQAHLNTLLQNAENMIAHNELDAAEALLRVIVKRDPQYAPAHAMLNSIKPVSAQKHYVDYDYRTGMFEVLDENDNRVTVFTTMEEAEGFARSRG